VDIGVSQQWMIGMLINYIAGSSFAHIVEKGPMQGKVNDREHVSDLYRGRVV
jgi:hypothetical protein